MDGSMVVATHVFAGRSVPGIDARELHAFMRVVTRYRDWIRRQIDYLGLIEGEDFVGGVSLKNERNLGGRPEIGHLLTTEAAKRIAITSRSALGRDAGRRLVRGEEAIREDERAKMAGLLALRDQELVVARLDLASLDARARLVDMRHRFDEDRPSDPMGAASGRAGSPGPDQGRDQPGGAHRDAGPSASASSGGSPRGDADPVTGSDPRAGAGAAASAGSAPRDGDGAGRRPARARRPAADRLGPIGSCRMDRLAALAEVGAPEVGERAFRFWRAEHGSLPPCRRPQPGRQEVNGATFEMRKEAVAVFDALRRARAEARDRAIAARRAVDPFRQDARGRFRARPKGGAFH